MNEKLLKWVREGNLTIPHALLSCYKELHLNEEELVLLLQLQSFFEKGNDFPTPNEISEKMTISSTHCSNILRRLLQKGIIAIEKGSSDTGILYEKYSIEPLWERLVNIFLQKENEQDMEVVQQSERDLYTVFEQEFGRPLSPFECETLTLWLDDDRHEPMIVKAALREAVISGKLNFRYIDRILFEWKKNGIKTIEQAKSYGNNFRAHQQQKNSPTIGSTSRTEAVPFYNWLEQK